MDELCEALDRKALAQQGAGTSNEISPVTATTPEESEEVRAQQRRLLAEIRSCFRVLSIHSRLSGSESPRTRRISTQTDSCESLHSLAGDRTKGSSPRVLRGLSSAEDAQNSLLYNQLIIESTSSSISSPASSVLQSHVGQQTRDDDAEEESHDESFHQRLILNPTRSLKTVLNLSKVDVLNVIEWLYRDHPGAVWRAASRKAMEDQDNRKHLIYGEITFVAFAKLLERYAPHKPLTSNTSAVTKDKGKLLANNSDREDIFPWGFTFYDLGCGAGRPVYMASLLNTNCTKSCGIEIVSNMHEMNNVLLKLYNLEVQPNLHPKKQSQNLDFLYGDFLEIDWSDGDIIFTNATCFGDPVFSRFQEIATKALKPGAIVMSVTRKFDNLESWELLETQERQMSWAPALVYVYRKRVTHNVEVEMPSTSDAPESTIMDPPPSSPNLVAQPVGALDQVAPPNLVVQPVEALDQVASPNLVAQPVEALVQGASPLELSLSNPPPT